ncbi:MAG: hypothetical protein V4436_01160 [Patescibacteria group bacterium]
MMATESSVASLPKPVADLRLLHDSVRVLGFGKPYDWSLRHYVRNPTEEQVRERTSAPALFLPQIATEREYNLRKMLYAPSPREFNAEVCTEADVMDSSSRVELRSELFHNTCTLLRGAHADGIAPLSQGYTYVVSPAGCPIIIVRDQVTGTVGVAHAGMRSLIDEGRLKGEAPRKYESVVMSLFEGLRARGVSDLSRVEVVILFSIDPQVFDYTWDNEKFGSLNEKRTEELARLWGPEAIYDYTSLTERRLGRPDLTAIIKSQCISLGVLPEHIQVVDSPSDQEWHHTRQGGDTLARNLVLVQHL